MLHALLFVAARAATVTVNGGAGCLSAVAVQVELDEVEGLLGSDRILVDIVRLDEPWTLHVRVVRREVEVWRRSLPVEPADCPLLPAALARTLQRGLEGVPRWPLNDRSPWSLGIQTVASWPYIEGGAALTFGHGPLARGVWSWEADLGVFTRTPQPVGRGRAALSGVMLGFAPVAEGRIGATRLGVRPRLAVGFGGRSEAGFDVIPEPAPLVPRGTVALEARARFPQGISAGLRASWIVVRTSFEDEDSTGNATRAPEPRFRLGFVIGLREVIGQ